MKTPAPRRSDATDFVVEVVGDETLVFDRRDNSAHCLSPVAAQVWDLCDGETDVERLVAAVAASGEADAPALVARALAELSEHGLLAEYGVSRRAIIARAAKLSAAGAISAPLILSVTAPTAAAAGSVATGSVCTSSGSSTGGCASNNDICTDGIGGNGTRYCVNKNNTPCRGATATEATCLSAGQANSKCCSGVCSGNNVCA